MSYPILVLLQESVQNQMLSDKLSSVIIPIRTFSTWTTDELIGKPIGKFHELVNPLHIFPRHPIR
jgi:hypothetical protein